MSLKRGKITSYLLNNNLFFVEVIGLTLPILLFRTRAEELIDLKLVKNLAFTYISLIALQLLVPAIYKAFEPNSKFKKENILAKVFYLSKLILLFTTLFATTKLLHYYLSPHNFTLLLTVLFLKLLIIKSKLDNFSNLKVFLVRFAYLIILSLFALLTYLELILLPASLIALSIGCLLTGISLIELYQKPVTPSNRALRIPGLMYLTHAGLQAIYVILQLTSPWHFLPLFFVPAIIEMTPAPQKEITFKDLLKYSKINILLFVLFLGIMLFL